MTLTQTQKGLIFTIIAIILVTSYFYPKQITSFFGTLIKSPQAITEASCRTANTHFDRVWILEDFKKEQSRLQNLIPDCKNNPNGGWWGYVVVDGITPQGNTYRMGGYSLKQVNGISCGIQESASFVGNTFPNEHLTDNYNFKVKVSGAYYLKAENYTIPHMFEWTDSADVKCITPQDKCNDGTPVDDGTHSTNFCSKTQQGKFCTDLGYLVDRAPFCACNPGFEAQGGECVLKEETNPPPPPPPPPVTTPPNTNPPPNTGGNPPTTTPPQNTTTVPPVITPTDTNTNLYYGISLLIVLGAGWYITNLSKR